MKANHVRRWLWSLGKTRMLQTASRSGGVPDGRAEKTSVFRWHLVCVGALAVMLTIFSAPLAAEEENTDIPFKYPFTETMGTDDVVISSVSVIPRKEGDPDPKPGETGAKLRVTVKEGKGFAKAIVSEALYGTFFQVFDGSAERFADTDSGQTAVRWSKQGTADVGHDTNAKALGVRGKAADWPHQEGTKPNRLIYWETDIPTVADHVEVVLVYTDALFDTNAQRRNNQKPQRAGDVPIVIGSWSGDLQEDGKWKFTKNAGDLFVHQDKYPTFAQISAFTTAAKGVVNTKTGYTLKERPATLAGIPITDAAKITAAIDLAVTKKQINPPPTGHPHSHDTGFDILRR